MALTTVDEFVWTKKRLRDSIEEMIPIRDDGIKLIDNPVGAALYPIFKDEKRTEAMVATLFWQIFKFTFELYYHVIAGISDKLNDAFVVCHGQGQYSLLIFDPFYKKDSPSIISAERFLPRKLDDGQKRWENMMNDKFERQLRSKPTSYLNEQHQRFMEISRVLQEYFMTGMLERIDFKVVICKMFQETNSSCWFASPSHNVSVDGRNNVSTAGAFAYNHKNQYGVTLSYHAVSQNLTRGNKLVYIYDEPAHIVSHDIISDSCFAVFDNQTIASKVPQFSIANGPLSGKTPRQYESAFFDGLTSGKMETIIQGWTPDIPFVFPDVQLRVITDADTNKGDSGASLLDADGNIIGFAFRRTGPTQRPSFSSWIWADSVFQFHKLKY